MKETEKNCQKINIRKNDQVFVIAGKEVGKKGRVLKVLRKTDRVVVEGLNYMKKAQRPTQKNSKGGILEKEAPIAVSNVMIFCPKCAKPTRTGHTILNDGKKVRVCKKCGESLDK